MSAERPIQHVPKSVPFTASASAKRHKKDIEKGGVEERKPGGALIFRCLVRAGTGMRISFAVFLELLLILISISRD